MEKLTAEIIKAQMIGQTSGHMAAIPNSPIIYSMFEVYKNSTDIRDDNVVFIQMIEDISKALKER